MKYLKTWKQINELHSDTYYSAADKMHKLGDSYDKRRRMKDMGDYRKSQEEMSLEPEEEGRRNKRSLFRTLSKNNPEILNKININNWRELKYSSLEEMVVGIDDIDILEHILKNTKVSITNQALLRCFNGNTIKEEKIKLLEKYGAEFNMSIVERILSMLYAGYSNSKKFGKSISNIDTYTASNILETILPKCNDLVDNGLVFKIQNESIYNIISKHIDVDLNFRNEEGNTILINNYVDTDIKSMWIRLGTDHTLKNKDGEGMEFTTDYKWARLLLDDFINIADFNHKNNNGDTVILKNIKHGLRNPDDLIKINMSTEYLLKAGADTMIKDSDGKVAFEYVLKYKMSTYNSKTDDIFTNLIKAGSEFEFDPKKPFIFHCIQHGLNDTAQTLVENGYDLEQKYRGKTAKDYAEQKRFRFRY